MNASFAFAEIPAACAPEYIENCDSEVALTMTSDTMGYVPTGDIANYCMPSTVEAIANGEVPVRATRPASPDRSGMGIAEEDK